MSFAGTTSIHDESRTVWVSPLAIWHSADIGLAFDWSSYVLLPWGLLSPISICWSTAPREHPSKVFGKLNILAWRDTMTDAQAAAAAIAAVSMNETEDDWFGMRAHTRACA